MVEPTGVKRKLAVILAADVEDFTRLTRADEEATHKTLSAYREIIGGLIARHEGRVVSAAGQSMLAEFDGPMGRYASNSAPFRNNSENHPALYQRALHVRPLVQYNVP